MKMRNKLGTLVQRRYPRKYARHPHRKIQVPSTPTKHKHEAPSSKNIFSRRYCATMRCPSESKFTLDVPNAPMYLPREDISCISLYRLNESPFSSRVDVRVRRHFDEGSCRYPRTLYHCEPPDCLVNRLLRRRSKKTSKLRVTGLCVGNSPVTGEFPAQMASNSDFFSIWWRHHVFTVYMLQCHSFHETDDEERESAHVVIGQIEQVEATLKHRHHHGDVTSLWWRHVNVQASNFYGLWALGKLILGLYSLSGRTPYRQILWSLEAARLDVEIIVSLWNLTGILAAWLPRYLSNFKAITNV